MKYSHFSRFLLFVLLAMQAAPGPDTRPRRALVGVLLQVGPNAQLMRLGTETRQMAAAGDLIYANSRLLTGGDQVSFAFYPEKGIYTFGAAENRAYPMRSFDLTKTDNTYELYFEATRFKPRPGVRLVDRQQAPEPLVEPQTDSSLSPRDRGSVDADMARVESALLKTALAAREQIILRLSRAALLEWANRLDDARQEYRRIASVWPKAGWIPGQKIVALEHQMKVDAAKAELARSAAKTYAMVIGVSDYQYSSRSNLSSALVPPVQFADRDAALIRDQLTRTPGAMSPDSVIALTNSDATKAAINANLKDLLERRAGPQDTVYLFLSGQGWTEIIDGRSKAFLMLWDSDPQEKQLTAYPLESLVEIVGRSLPKLKQVYVVADICRMETYREAPNTINAAMREQFGALKGSLELVLASSADRSPVQISRVDASLEGGHGLFAYYFVQALRGAAAAIRGRVSNDEVFRYVSEAVGKATANRQQPARVGRITVDFPVGQPAAAYRPAARPRPLALLAMAGFHPSGLLSAQAEDEPQSDPSNVDKLNRGQQLLLRYLNGEEDPPKKEEFRDAAGLFGEANRLAPSPELRARELFCEGRALAFEKKPEAVEMLEQAIELDQDAAYAYNALGIAQLQQARYPEAAWSLRDAIRRAPGWIYPRHNLALTYSEAGAYVAAEREYRTALRIEPNYSYVHYSLASLLLRLGRTREAGREYQAAIQINPANAEAYTGLGATMAALGKRTEAERDYRKAIDLNPKLPAAAHDLGLLYLRQRRTKDALAAWEANVSRNPDFTPSRMSLAQEYRVADRFDDAIAQYQAVLTASPKYVAAAMAVAETQGDRERKAGRKTAAAEHYNRALALAADDGDIRRIKRKLR